MKKLDSSKSLKIYKELTVRQWQVFFVKTKLLTIVNLLVIISIFLVSFRYAIASAFNGEWAWAFPFGFILLFMFYVLFVHGRHIQLTNQGIMGKEFFPFDRGYKLTPWNDFEHFHYDGKKFYFELKRNDFSGGLYGMNKNLIMMIPVGKNQETLKQIISKHLPYKNTL